MKPILITDLEDQVEFDGYVWPFGLSSGTKREENTFQGRSDAQSIGFILSS